MTKIILPSFILRHGVYLAPQRTVVIWDATRRVYWLHFNTSYDVEWSKAQGNFVSRIFGE